MLLRVVNLIGRLCTLMCQQQQLMLFGNWEQVYNITVNNSDGDEAARIDDTGISLRMENKSWLKTKVANWIGVKYL